MSKLDHVKLEDLRYVVDQCEGWSIFSPDDTLFDKLPKRFWQPLVTVYKSDYSNPKATIFGPTGAVKPKMEGIHDLNLIYAICRELGVDINTSLTGRGFQTKELKRRLAVKFQEMENAAQAQS
jgi:hypothetical protein